MMYFFEKLKKRTRPLLRYVRRYLFYGYYYTRYYFRYLRHRRYTTFFLVVLILVGLLILQNRSSILSFLGLSERSDSEFSLIELEKQVLTTPPLRGPTGRGESHITQQGIIDLTNAERKKEGLDGLGKTTELVVSAAAKADDIFSRQYFDIISPDGTTVKDFVARAKYTYVAIGETIIMGNYVNDQALIDALMDSPAHRANILHPGFTAIGVAISRHAFEGNDVWVVVQHFGRPPTECPSEPVRTLLVQIESQKDRINEIEGMIDAFRKELEDTTPDTENTEKTQEHNKLVHEFNGLVEETRILVNDYNGKARAYNDCAKGVL